MTRSMSVRNARGASIFAGAFLALATLVAGGLLGLERVEVRGNSMQPTLADGDWLIARRYGRRRSPSAGHVVLARHPFDGPDILKRVESVDVHGAWLLGDNSDASTDSRHFGPIEPGTIRARIVARYWPRARVGRVR